MTGQFKIGDVVRFRECPDDPTQYYEVLSIWSDADIELLWLRWRPGYGFPAVHSRDVVKVEIPNFCQACAGPAETCDCVRPDHIHVDYAQSRAQRAIEALTKPDASLASVPNTIRQSLREVIEDLAERSKAK